MEIKLTNEQCEQIFKDGWINITVGNNHWIYIEFDDCSDFWYFELVRTDNTGKHKKYYAYDTNDLDRLRAKRLCDPSYYHNDSLCPNCGTYMIYRFEHCPKCGQKLDWSEK